MSRWRICRILDIRSRARFCIGHRIRQSYLCFRHRSLQGYRPIFHRHIEELHTLNLLD